MSQNNPAKSKQPQTTVGGSILAAMTEREVALILDILVANFPPSSLEIALDRLPTNTRETLEQILNPVPPTAVTAKLPPPITKPEKPISIAKLEETWSKLWGEWDDIVAEATDEEGKYIEQEAHWEPPYFNDSALIEDLETLARQMQPLLANAYEYGFAPNVDFAQALEDMAGEIGSAMTNGIELINERFYLEHHLTTCLLEWERLKAQEDGIDAFAFIQRIREWEDSSEQIKLHDITFFNFVAQLPDPDLQRIYEGLTANREALLWKIYLDDIRSPWHQVYLYCLEKYDPDCRLTTLRATIPQKWTNGLPVIEDLLAKGSDRESLAVIEETLASLLKYTRRDPNWSPESSLLITGGGFYGEHSAADEVTLLRYCQEIASRLDRSDRVAALQIQLIACEHRFNWSIMLAAFRDETVPPAISQQLFKSWRDYIISTTDRGSSGWGNRQTDSSWWLSWLLDSLNDSPQSSEDFARAIEQWLTNLKRDENRSRQDFFAIRLLTHDLGAIRGENWNRYPNFLATVLMPRNLQTADTKSRQSFLQQLAPQDLWGEIMAYWQSHLTGWIPPPETARKSDYTEQSKWVAALREISPTAYQNLLAQWRGQHKQRRNLWKALEQMGLS